jgi:hypothetical protein
MSDELTSEQLDELESAVKGFVGVDWEQGCGDCEANFGVENGRAAVVDEEHLGVLLDCSDHDCGPEMAAALVAMHKAFPALLRMAQSSIQLRKRMAECMTALRAEQENTAQRAREMADTMGGDYARGRRDAVADMAHPCTCGSGAHPRECKRHLWAFEAHIEEMSLEQSAIEGAVHGSVRRLSERVREADELLDSAMRMVGGSWEQELEAYRAKWGDHA